MSQIQITTVHSDEEVQTLAQAIAAILLPQIAALQSAGAIINNVNTAAEGSDDAGEDEPEEKQVKKTTTTRRTSTKNKTPADDSGAGEEKKKTGSDKKAPPKKNAKVDLTALKSDVADWLEWIEDDADLTAEVDAVLESFDVSAEPDVEDDVYPDFHAKLRTIIAANFQID